MKFWAVALSLVVAATSFAQIDFQSRVRYGGTGWKKAIIVDPALNPATDAGFVTGNHSWVNGGTVAFELDFDITTRVLTQTLGGNSISRNIGTTLGWQSLELTANGQTSRSATMTFKDIVTTVDGSNGSLGDMVATTDAGVSQILNIVDGADWNIQGNIISAWGSSPSGERNRLNINGYEPVPEPATMTLLGLGALAALRRRKKA